MTSVHEVSDWALGGLPASGRSASGTESEPADGAWKPPRSTALPTVGGGLAPSWRLESLPSPAVGSRRAPRFMAESAASARGGTGTVGDESSGLCGSLWDMRRSLPGRTSRQTGLLSFQNQIMPATDFRGVRRRRAGHRPHGLGDLPRV